MSTLAPPPTGKTYRVRAPLSDGTVFEGTFDHPPTQEEVLRVAQSQKYAAQHSPGGEIAKLSQQPELGIIDSLRNWLAGQGSEARITDEARAEARQAGIGLTPTATELAGAAMMVPLAIGAATAPIPTLGALALGAGGAEIGGNITEKLGEAFAPGSGTVTRPVGELIGMTAGGAYGAKKLPTLAHPRAVAALTDRPVALTPQEALTDVDLLRFIGATGKGGAPSAQLAAAGMPTSAAGAAEMAAAAAAAAKAAPVAAPVSTVLRQVAQEQKKGGRSKMTPPSIQQEIGDTALEVGLKAALTKMGLPWFVSHPAATRGLKIIRGLMGRGEPVQAPIVPPGMAGTGMAPSTTLPKGASPTVEIPMGQIRINLPPGAVENAGKAIALTAEQQIQLDGLVKMGVPPDRALGIVMGPQGVTGRDLYTKRPGGAPTAPTTTKADLNAQIDAALAAAQARMGAAGGAAPAPTTPAAPAAGPPVTPQPPSPSSAGVATQAPPAAPPAAPTEPVVSIEDLMASPAMKDLAKRMAAGPERPARPGVTGGALAKGMAEAREAPDVLQPGDLTKTETGPAGRKKMKVTKKGPDIKRQPIESRGFKTWGYDAKNRILDLEFPDGRVYRYHGVVPQEIAAVEAAESKGAALLEITRRHPGTRQGAGEVSAAAPEGAAAPETPPTPPTTPPKGQAAPPTNLGGKAAPGPPATPPEQVGAALEASIGKPGKKVQIISTGEKGRIISVIKGGPSDKAGKGNRPPSYVVELENGTTTTVNARGTRVLAPEGTEKPPTGAPATRGTPPGTPPTATPTPAPAARPTGFLSGLKGPETTTPPAAAPKEVVDAVVARAKATATAKPDATATYNGQTVKVGDVIPDGRVVMDIENGKVVQFERPKAGAQGPPGTSPKAPSQASLPPGPEGETPKTRFAVQPTRLGLYSQLERVVSDPKTQATQRGADWLKFLKDPKRAVTADELKWTGVDDLLLAKSGERVTKQEILDTIKANNVEVEETHLGGTRIDWDDPKVAGHLNTLNQNGIDVVNDPAEGITFTFNDPDGPPTFMNLHTMPRVLVENRYKPSTVRRIVAAAGAVERYIKTSTAPSRESPGIKPYADELEKLGFTLEQSPGDPSIIMFMDKDQGDLVDAADIARFADQMAHGAARDQLNRAATLAKTIEGNWRSAIGQGMKPTGYAEYTVPGATNYREVILRAPVKKGDFRLERAAKTERGVQSGDWRVFGPDNKFWGTVNGEMTEVEARAAVPEMFRMSELERPQFESGHWEGEPNPIASVRLSDRTGPNGEKILFIEELQSDWAQQGRTAGFVKSEGAYRDEVAKELFQKPYEALDEAQQANVVDEIDARGTEGGGAGGFHNITRKVQPGPYVEDTNKWTELAFKRILRLASDEGYDEVAWAPGKVHTNRWGTERIAWKKYEGEVPESAITKRMENDAFVDWARDQGVPPSRTTRMVQSDAPWSRADNDLWTQFVTAVDNGEVNLEAYRPKNVWMVEAKRQHGGQATGIDIEAEATRRGLNPNEAAPVSSQRELERLLVPVMNNDEDQAAAAAAKLWKRMQTEPEGVSMPRKEGFEDFYDKTFMPNAARKVAKKFGGTVGETQVETSAIATEARKMAEAAEAGESEAWSAVAAAASRGTTPEDIPNVLRKGARNGNYPEEAAETVIAQFKAAMSTGPLTETLNAPSIKLTPEMRGQISEKGFSRFAVAGKTPKNMPVTPKFTLESVENALARSNVKGRITEEGGSFILNTRGGRIVIEPVSEVTPDWQVILETHGPSTVEALKAKAKTPTGKVTTLSSGWVIKATHEGVLTHEVPGHIFLDHFAKPKERAAIFRELGKDVSEKALDERWAEWYSDWYQNRRNNPPETVLDRVFQRIYEFLDDVYRMMTGEPTLESVARRVEKGKWLKGEPTSRPSGGFAWSVEPRKIGSEERELNFDRWFGNSRVKVKDATGRSYPLPVYHATHEPGFTEFKVGRVRPEHLTETGNASKAGVDSIGAWFAEDPDFASTVAKFYKNPEKSKREFLADRGVDKIDVGENANIMPVYLSIERPLVVRSRHDLTTRIAEVIGNDRDDIIEWELNLDGGDLKAIDRARTLLMMKGYDGILVKNDMGFGRAWVALDPRQIKSATGNVGTFSIESPDIRFGTATAKVPRAERAKNLDAWFGKSKAVDKKGKPLTLYHGTNVEINKFKPAVFLTEDRAIAGDYAESWGGEGNAVYPMYASIKNPLNVDNNLRALVKIARDAGVKVDYDPRQRLFKYKTPPSAPLGMGDWDENPFNLAYLPKVRDAIKSAGYDGLTGKDFSIGGYENKIWVALDSNQVKSATGNVGTFSPKTGDIRFSIGRYVKPGPPRSPGGETASMLRQADRSGMVHGRPTNVRGATTGVLERPAPPPRLVPKAKPVETAPGELKATVGEQQAAKPKAKPEMNPIQVAQRKAWVADRVAYLKDQIDRIFANPDESGYRHSGVIMSDERRIRLKRYQAEWKKLDAEQRKMGW